MPPHHFTRQPAIIKPDEVPAPTKPNVVEFETLASVFAHWRFERARASKVVERVQEPSTNRI
jgi:hypothetical protein